MSKPQTEPEALQAERPPVDHEIKVYVAEELMERPFEVVRSDGMTDEDVAMQTKLVHAVLARAKRG